MCVRAEIVKVIFQAQPSINFLDQAYPYMDMTFHLISKAVTGTPDDTNTLLSSLGCGTVTFHPPYTVSSLCFWTGIRVILLTPSF
jgi:hypothetical protein